MNFSEDSGQDSGSLADFKEEHGLEENEFKRKQSELLGRITENIENKPKSFYFVFDSPSQKANALEIIRNGKREDFDDLFRLMDYFDKDRNNGNGIHIHFSVRDEELKDRIEKIFRESGLNFQTYISSSNEN